MSRDMPKDPSGKPMWYGRRRTHKLRPGRQQLVDTLLPKLLVADRAGNAPVAFPPGFGPPARELRLEIGFGAGEHLSGEAAANPDVDFIGCEPFINGVAALLADIDGLGLGNIRIFDDDVRLLLQRLPAASVSVIYILFPRPVAEGAPQPPPHLPVRDTGGAVAHRPGRCIVAVCLRPHGLCRMGARRSPAAYGLDMDRAHGRRLAHTARGLDSDALRNQGNPQGRHARVSGISTCGAHRQGLTSRRA